MLKITKHCDYGVLIMAELASIGVGRRESARTIAERTKVPPPMASKILKQLVSTDLVDSKRGAHGGYALVRPPQNITVKELLDALDGPVALTECSGPGACECGIEEDCTTRPMWRTINRRVGELLNNITLAEMLGPMPDIEAMEVAQTPRDDGRCPVAIWE